MKPIRVLHVVPSVAITDGGPSKAIALMERALSDAGVSVTTLTTDLNPSGFGSDKSCPPTIANGASRIYARKWTNLYKVAPGIVPYLMRHIRSFDVVHIHALFSFSSTIAAWIARVQGVPYIIRPLGTLNTYGTNQRRRRLKSLSLQLIEGPIISAAAAIHFTSVAEMEETQNLGLDFKSFVSPLGIEREATGSPDDILAAHPELLGRRVILFLSRIDPKKNLEALIDAFGYSHGLKSECAIIIAGGGDDAYVDSLMRRVEAAEIRDRVVWLGHVEGALKRSSFACADVFVLPSYSENFGIAAVEAMLTGLPCVLTPGVAIAREAAAAGAAVLSEPDAPTLAMAITNLLRNETERRAMGGRARRFAIETFSTSAMARSLIAQYERIISSRVEGAA